MNLFDKLTTLIWVFVVGIVSHASVVVAAEEYECFNDDWLFTLSDTGDYSLTNFEPDLENWRELNLPHDWTIESEFSMELEGCTAFMPGGIGWYRKSFNTPISEDQKYYIVFDGIYNNAEFWLNGMKIGDHPYGYAPIYFDLTDFLAPKGEGNILSVRVDHSRYADSRWYTGSGIYRNVHIFLTDKLHIPVWGTFVTTPEVSAENATVNLSVDLKNDHAIEQEVMVITDLVDANGMVVASAHNELVLVGNTDAVCEQRFTVKSPRLWDATNPYLYVAKTRLEVDENILAVRETRFGIRSFHFDKDRGFFLNGKNVKIKGVCLHHDAGVVGTAVPKDVWKRRLLKLKEMGCNAIRSSHNPASDEFLDLCDELGFLVQNEFYDEWDLPKDKRYNMHDKEVDFITRGHSQHFQLWAERDLKNTMRSSRNHPCIFQWSIGNEIEWTYPGNRGASGIFKETNKDDKMDWTLWRTEVPPHTPEQVRAFWNQFPEQTFSMGETAKQLAAWTREMDVTRPVTANLILPTSSYETEYAEVLDVIGFSYKPHKYDYFKQTYPDKPMMGTENVPQWYEWKAAAERDFIAGVFLWTGVDYMGECRDEHWPRKATNQGPLDLAGFPRGSFYMYQSLWRDNIPVLEMATQTADLSIYQKNASGRVVEKQPNRWKLAPREWQLVNPHWNYTSGEQTVVEVYSNCESVELFLNGKTLGKQLLIDQEDRIFKWAVSFQSGELMAKGHGKDGQVTETMLQTAGDPYSIRLIPDRDRMSANQTDVVHVVAQFVDSNGCEVKFLEDDITFEISGAHRFLGTDCGDTTRMKGFKSKTVSTAFGKCLLMLQSTDEPSEIIISAKGKQYQCRAESICIRVDRNSHIVD